MKRGTMTPEEIRKAIKDLNMTITEFASACGVSYAAINQYTTGKRAINLLVEEKIQRLLESK